MKYFICTLFCLFSLICQAEIPENKENSCLDNFKEYIQYSISNLDKHLDDLEYEGAEIKMNFDYHAGFFMGQRKAYQDVLERIPE